MEHPKPDLFSRIIKWSFNPENRGPHLLRTLFFVIPVMMLPIVMLTSGGRNFFSRYIYSVLVGDCISLVCSIFSNTLRLVAVRWLRLTLRRRTFILVSAAGMGPGMWIAFHLVDPIVARFLPIPIETHDLSDYSTGFMIGGLILTIISLADLWITARSETERLKRETLEAKLSALSAQLNPHLLFNALNTIASTIPSDPRAAEETTLRLSELYRGILSSSQRVAHPLGTELDICRAYLGVESARFADRLKWSIDASPELLSREIPALLIQPLVENAIKHGLSQKAAGGKIAVRVSHDGDSFQIVVEDDGVGLGQSKRAGTGTGVSSCRSRLELIYHGLATFRLEARPDGPGTRVTIRIPEEVSV